MEREHLVVFECPGCGAKVTIRSTRMARVEWCATLDGRFTGFATCAHAEDEPDFAFLQSGEASMTAYYSDSPNKVHECQRGGDTNSPVVRS